MRWLRKSECNDWERWMIWLKNVEEIVVNMVEECGWHDWRNTNIIIEKCERHKWEMWMIWLKNINDMIEEGS